MREKIQPENKFGHWNDKMNYKTFQKLQCEMGMAMIFNVDIVVRIYEKTLSHGTKNHLNRQKKEKKTKKKEKKNKLLYTSNLETFYS